MKTETRPRGVLPLTPCSYGLSKLTFRGPNRPTDGTFIAVLGGSETFGKFIAKPYSDLIEAAIGEVCVNLGYQAAGPDVFVYDSAVGSLCHDAKAVVIQLMGAANLTNMFYKVHPRRNDRFIGPTDKLLMLYPEVDFSDITFTGHLVTRLRAIDPDRFVVVGKHLQKTWMQRMKLLIGRASGSVVLLWMAPRAPDDPDTTTDPLFVTRPMLEHLRGYVDDIVEVEGETGQTDGMFFAPLDALAAAGMMGVSVHQAAAEALRIPLLAALDT